MTMMPKARKTLTLLLAGLALVASVQSSAIKGQQPQSQPVQRLDEQAARGVKSPVQQYSDHRSPKSSGAPVLESSKKVYNDESIRTRSVPIQLQQQQLLQQQLQQQQPQQQAVVVEPAVAVKSAPAPVLVEPVVVPAVVPAVAAAPAVVVEQPAVPASVSQPVAAPSVVQKESVVVAPAAVAQPQPVVPVAAAAAPVAPVVEPMKPTFVEAPSVVKASEELPPQSDRSAPIKEEKPVVVAAAPSVVVVEHVVPAKAPVVVEPQQAAPVKPVEPPMAVVVEPKPVVVAAADSPLMAKKDQEIVAKEPLAAPVEAPIEVPAPDPGLVLSEPIDSTTKLLIDLDEHVQKFLPAEDKQEPAQPAKEQVLVSGVDYSPPAAAAAAAPASPEQVLPISGKSSVPLVPYSSSQVDPSTGEPIVPPLPSLEKVEKASGVVAASSLGGPVASSASSAAAAAAAGAAGQSATRQANNHHHQGQNQQQVITQLLDQLDSLQNRIQDTINQLVARRRYVMSALLRPMGTYVRRVRTNLERLQNRVNQLQAAAVSVGGGQGPNRPGGFVDAAAIETIRRRIDDISKRISDIVNRIRFSLTPTSAPLNSNGRK